MTIILEKIINRAVNTFRLNKIAYKMSRTRTVCTDPHSTNLARTHLQAINPNVCTSPLCCNIITPQVDVHIIIPAYNVEKYVKDCLDSIVLKPSLKYTYLVTVINDGSTDSTAEILREYEKLNCVEVITQENRGFSGARNRGLSNIKGKYVIFVDSDDKMDWYGVEKMLAVAEETNAQIVRGAYYTISENGKELHFHENKNKKPSISELGGQPWAKLFRAELFCDVCFPERYWYEDSIFSHIVYPRITVAYGIPENTYYYRERATGITKQGIKKAKSIDSYWITERLFEERKKYGLEITDKYYDFILRMVKLTFLRIRYQPYETKKSVFILFCDFIDKNFPEYDTQDEKLKDIQRIIKAKDLGKCIAYARWM